MPWKLLAGSDYSPERTRPAAGLGLIMLLIAVWPANLQMLLDARDAGKPAWWVALLWARLPLQVILIAWVCAAYPAFGPEYGFSR